MITRIRNMGKVGSAEVNPVFVSVLHKYTEAPYYPIYTEVNGLMFEQQPTVSGTTTAEISLFLLVG